MKKDYEVYRDTGVLGSYHPEMAILREQCGGEVMTTSVIPVISSGRITWRASGRCLSEGKCFM